tara:strand:+ start:1047 stop:1337 length:291 start_codon:yes stop_codon:yes gene_type:complete
MKRRDRKHLAKLAALGCIVCRNEGHGITPPEYTSIHHPRANQGMAMRAPDSQAIPLCAAHHTGGIHGVSIHAGQKTWEDNFGTETELLRQVSELLA